MLFIALGGTICSLTASFFSSRIAMGLGKILRKKVFAKVTDYSLQEFDKISTASLITRTTNDITQVQMVYMIIMRMMVAAPMMMIGGIIMAVREDKQLSLLLVVILPLLIGVIALLASLAIPLFKVVQKRIDRINLVVRENLVGVRVIRAFNRIEHEKVRFTGANKELTDVSISVNRIMAVLMPVLMLVMNLTTVAIVWFGSKRIDAGAMQVGSLMAFIQYAMQILMALVMASMMFIMIPRAAVSAARINEVLGLEPQVKDPAVPAICDESTKGFIEFKDVTFSYPGAEEPAIKNVSFTANPNEVTAIIGGTGSGKSTLVNLIPRFYDVDSGSILIDGIDIREMTQETLRRKLGFVPQSTVLFTGTIAENIRYGKTDADIDEIRHAAETSQSMEFISEMPEGLDSVIAEGGTNVSGGQKQRLSIARALVRRPEIYIFDDSFSALDFRTDSKLRAALKNEIQNSTVIIVAQRVGTVMSADRIIVMDEGKVICIGTHKELIRTCDIYREIVASQLSEEELA